MSAVAELDHLSRNEILDRCDVLHTTARRAEAEVLVLAVRFALLHGAVHTDTPGAKPLPGRASLNQFGGRGTPLMAEFTPVMLAARLGLSPYAGASLVADALDLHYRLPCLWERVQALEVKPSYAREVARRTRNLPATQAAFVDEQVTDKADGRVSWTRFTELIDATIITADPAAAARREHEAKTRQVASPTRSNEHGMRGFYLQAPFPVIARLDATVTYVAQALQDFGDTTTLDDRRVKAVLILANPTQAVHLLRAYATWRRGQTPTTSDTKAEQTTPDPKLDGQQRFNPADLSPNAGCGSGGGAPGPDQADVTATSTCGSAHGAPIADPADVQPVDTRGSGARAPIGDPAGVSPTKISTPVVDDADLLPAVHLFVHLAQETVEAGCNRVARIEGPPPITAQWVKQHLGGCRVTVTPVIDLANQTPVDAWEIPQRHRHAVHLMTPADTFPFATNTNRAKQIDHTIPYQDTGPPGQSRLQLRTHDGVPSPPQDPRWLACRPAFPGIYLWRDPTETATYVVDHTGTRRVDQGPSQISA